MLHAKSVHTLEEIEHALRIAAQRHGGRILAVSHMGKAGEGEALAFTVCLTELYAPLLAADSRFAAFLPARIAACREGEGVRLETISPDEYCRLLNRPDLIDTAAPLESALRAILDDAAQFPAASVQATRAGIRTSGLGATEEQVNLRASLPQRIDCHGTKVEDLGGTGIHDAQGG
jgi:hypothetical protein